MRVLIDTNIIIYREDNKVLTDNLQFLMRSLNDLKNEVVVHPFSIEEIKRDSDEIRRKISLSKVQTYSPLENPPSFEKDIGFTSIVKPRKDPHDHVDNALLYSVCKNAVSFFITEDKELHKKAFKLNIDEQVLSIAEAVNVFKTQKPPSTPPAILKEKVHNLNIDDKIFDSLKEEYPKFEEWFEKIKLQGRDCLVYRNYDDSLGALLIYKDENEVIGLKDKILPAKERMKIATLKVSSNGYKIGEFFLAWATKYAIKNNFEEIYLTHYSKPEDYLVYLIEEYGFLHVGQNKIDEDVFVKYLKPTHELVKNTVTDGSPLEISKKFYPKFYDGNDVKKFVVPIWPEYHEKLFIGSERQTTLYEHNHGFIVEGNAIKKAYLSHSNIKKISPGDLLLFYRTDDIKAITCIGVVEKVIPDLEDADEITREVGKRTVYSPEEIEEFADNVSPTLVLLFIFSTWLPNNLNISNLKELDVLRAAPQTITEISHERYLNMKKAGGIDESFIIN
jgi:rRNA-processing protein FCF1